MATDLTERFTDAVTYATRLHEDQLRKGTEIPYVAHLLSVTALVLEHGGTEDEAIAALLHDAVEDQGGAPTLEVIRAKFGDTVAATVDGCTDSAEAKGAPKGPWKKRKQAYIDHIAREKDRSILLVSAADKLHNARALLGDYEDHGDALWDRFNAGRDDILWYYRELVDAFGQAEERLNKKLPEPDAGLGRMLNRLQETVEELHLMVEISESEDALDLFDDE